MDTTRFHNSDGSEPPCCNLKEVDWRPLLGLKMKKSQGLTSLLQRRLDNLPRPPITDNINYVGSQLVVHHPQPRSEKLKASNFPMNTISIGPWKRVARHEGELTAKLYFAKRKLVWEFLEGQLKSKIEVSWSDITAIKALMLPNQPGTLQIELGKAPLFFREINPQPRKHTNWQEAADFTQGHAPLYRRHYATFPPGVVDIHYDKLLQCDQRLFQLSRNPFPTHHHSPFFNTTPTTTTTTTTDVAFNNHQQPIPPLDLNPFMTAAGNMVVESPRNNETLLLELENQTTTAAGMDVNYFQEASFLDSSGGSHLHHQLTPPPPHDHVYYNNNNNNNIDDDQSLTAAGSEFMNLSVPYNSLYAADNINAAALQPPISTWLPPTPTPTPTLEDVVDTKPNLDDLDHHINYQNLYHHPPPQY